MPHFISIQISTEIRKRPGWSIVHKLANSRQWYADQVDDQGDQNQRTENCRNDWSDFICYGRIIADHVGGNDRSRNSSPKPNVLQVTIMKRTSFRSNLNLSSCGGLNSSLAFQNSATFEGEISV